MAYAWLQITCGEQLTVSSKQHACMMASFCSSACMEAYLDQFASAWVDNASTYAKEQGKHSHANQHA